jgi:hypothetical protein
VTAIVVVGPDASSVIPLDADWGRLCMGASTVKEVAALALLWRYPPAGDGLALAKVAVPFASAGKAGIEEVGKVSEVALEANTHEGDRKRLEEAYSLWRNNPRAPRPETIQAAVEEAWALVDLYWALRGWLVAKEREWLDVTVGRYQVQARP